MAQYINPSKTSPICDAVFYTGRVMETVICPIPDGQDKVVSGGAREHMVEIVNQLEELLLSLDLHRTHVVSVRLYLAHVNRDIAQVNEVYKQYFGAHTPMRCAVGAELQADMLVEACIKVEAPQ